MYIYKSFHKYKYTVLYIDRWCACVYELYVPIKNLVSPSKDIDVEIILRQTIKCNKQGNWTLFWENKWQFRSRLRVLLKALSVFRKNEDLIVLHDDWVSKMTEGHFRGNMDKLSQMIHGAGIFTYKTGWFSSGQC